MKIELTTKSSASSYGIPVARIDGQDYGPGDTLGDRLVAEIVSKWAEDPERSEEDRQLVKKFLSCLP